MSDKIATPKTPQLAPAKKALAIRKAAPQKKPAAKVAKSAKISPVAIALKHDKKTKKTRKNDDKIKVIRDSFTMPQNDYEKITELKELCLKSGMHVKKSELLRAGLHALGKMRIAQLRQALSGLEKIKTGRPKKNNQSEKN